MNERVKGTIGATQNSPQLGGTAAPPWRGGGSRSGREGGVPPVELSFSRTAHTGGAGIQPELQTGLCSGAEVVSFPVGKRRRPTGRSKSSRGLEREAGQGRDPGVLVTS